MKIFKDIITNDEMFSDIYPMEKLHDNSVYKVQGKMVTKNNAIDESAFGFNKSEEGGDDEGTEDGVTTVIDIVDGCKLVEMPAFKDKKEYKAYLKEYFKSVKEKLEKEEDVTAFQKGAQEFIKAVLGEFSEYQFFVGESMNPDGMHALCKWDDDTPYFYFFKHGLEEEKC